MNSGSHHHDPLTAAVAIATFGREEVLVAALDHLARQTRPAKQVLVACENGDAARVAELIERRLPGLSASSGFELVRSERGSTVQRNAAIDRVDADVTLFLDDDALAEPRYIERVLAVFERDVEGRIGGVQGQAIEGREAAAYWAKLVSSADAETPAASPSPSAGGGIKGALKRRVKPALDRWRRRGMMWYVPPFAPADVLAPAHGVPGALADMNLTPLSHLYGCVMSFRTALLREHRFNDLMRDYAFMEDFDLSYRIGRTHGLVRQPEARAYHVQAGGGRVGAYQKAYSYLLNMALIARTAIGLTSAVERQLLRHHRRYTRWQGLNIPMSRDGWANYRGARDGLRAARRLLALDDAEIAEFMRAHGRPQGCGE